MKTGKLVLYLGGIRSGKSGIAQERVKAFAGQGAVAYLATAMPPKPGKDRELARRLAEHRASRPRAWVTMEGWKGLVQPLKKASKSRFKALLLDGLGMYVAANMDLPEAQLLDEARVFGMGCRHQAALSVVVADEVGLGGVPGHPVARRFADLNGRVNQVFASVADEVFFVMAGTALKIK